MYGNRHTFPSPTATPIVAIATPIVLLNVSRVPSAILDLPAGRDALSWFQERWGSGMDRKRDDVSATNRDFIDYDQVRQEQRSRLAEAAGAEAFDEEFRVRTCDIGRFLHGGELDRRE